MTAPTKSPRSLNFDAPRNVGLRHTCFVWLLLLAGSALAQDTTFTTTKANLTASRASLDVPGLAGNPRAIIVATPLDDTEQLNPHVIGAWYSNDKWNIFNADHANLGEGLTFKVQVFLRADANHFLHIVTPRNLVRGSSYIDSPSLNNNPNAQVTIFLNHSPEQRSSSLNPYRAQAAYDPEAAKWMIKNIDDERLPPNTAYNIVVSSGGSAGGLPVSPPVGVGIPLGDVPPGRTPTPAPTASLPTPPVGKGTPLPEGTGGPRRLPGGGTPPIPPPPPPEAGPATVPPGASPTPAVGATPVIPNSSGASPVPPYPPAPTTPATAGSATVPPGTPPVGTSASTKLPTNGTPVRTPGGGKSPATPLPAANNPGAALPGTPIGSVPVAGTPRAIGETVPTSPPLVSGTQPAVPQTPAVTPVNPSQFLGEDLGNGEVALTWKRVPGVTYYLLLGPGISNDAAKVPNLEAETYGVQNEWVSSRAYNVPPGTQEWAVGSYYEPGPTSTAANAFPRLTLTIAAPVPVETAPPTPTPTPATVPPPAPVTSGKYLVTVTGLRAYEVSTDDVLSRDGMGDEVYAAAYVRRYDRRTGQLVGVMHGPAGHQVTVPDSKGSKTMPYGDVAHFANERIQAGRWSATGGIADGDPIPDGALVARRTLPAQASMFPWRLWEGTLTDGIDAVVVMPTIWEQDGGTAFYTQWQQQQAALTPSLFTNQRIQDQITQQAFSVVMSGASSVQNDVLGSLFFSISFKSMLSGGPDRPIGLVENGPNGTALPSRAVVLTREIIEAALARPAIGVFASPFPTVPGVLAPVPGLLMIEFYDAQAAGGLNNRRARYQMFIQVERLP